MKAIRTQADHTAAVVDHPIPTLRPSYILIRVHAVGLNPVDFKFIDFMGDADRTLGCEAAGTVVEVGAEVTAKFKKGDRILGITHGSNTHEKDDGSFAEYALLKGDISILIPRDMSWEAACVLPMGAFTAALGLYQQMGLPEPGSVQQADQQRAVLIYGASSTTGLYCLKLAKLSGLEVWATCSPVNNDLVRSEGASHIYDYSSPTCAADIRRDSGNSIFYAFDCISNDVSVPIVSEALSDDTANRKPIHHVLRQNLDFPREDVKVTYALTFTLMGESIGYKGGSWFEASENDFNWAKRFSRAISELLEQKHLVPVTPVVVDGGLDGVLQGIDLYRKGKISGQKLACRIG